MKKKSRESMSIRKYNDIFLVRLNNNNIVTLASSCCGCHPVTKIKRIASVNKKIKISDKT